MSRFLQIVLVALVLLAGTPLANVNVQDKKSSLDDQKPEQIIKRAIDVYGGSVYLNVHTIIGRGFYTMYRDGLSQLPARFVDYIVYPDKERTEFTGGGTHLIQANFGDQGWNFDGATKTIKDQKPEQIEDFKFAVKTSIDYLLRGNWRKERAKLR